MSVDLQADSLGSFECHAAEGAPALYGASSIDGEKSGAKEAAGSGSGPCKRTLWMDLEYARIPQNMEALNENTGTIFRRENSGPF